MLRILVVLSVAIAATTSGSIAFADSGHPVHTATIVTHEHPGHGGHSSHGKHENCHELIGLDRETCAKLCARKIAISVAVSSVPRPAERFIYFAETETAVLCHAALRPTRIAFGHKWRYGPPGSCRSDGRSVIAETLRYRL